MDSYPLKGVMRMRSVRMMALALAFGGLTATAAWAQSDYGPSASPPGLLPLPEISTAWANGDGNPATNYASQTSVNDYAPDDSFNLLPSAPQGLAKPRHAGGKSQHAADDAPDDAASHAAGRPARRL